MVKKVLEILLVWKKENSRENILVKFLENESYISLTNTEVNKMDYR